jgi:transposase-like protein
VRDKLPDKLRAVTEKRMRHAYHAESALKAEAELEALARELGKTHPGAASSLREGMAETLTILRLGVPPTLARTLRSTNSIVPRNSGQPPARVLSEQARPPGQTFTSSRPKIVTHQGRGEACHQ